MAKIDLPKGSGKQLKVRKKSVKSQGILKWILSGNPGRALHMIVIFACYVLEVMSDHLFSQIKSNKKP